MLHQHAFNDTPQVPATMQTKSFIIHLARAAARRHLVDGLIVDCPASAQIVDAVDGRQLDDWQIEDVYRRDLFEPRYPFALRNSEIGCFMRPFVLAENRK